MSLVHCDFIEVGKDANKPKSESSSQTVSNEVETTNPEHENYCGDCYGAQGYQGQCCNTCDDVRAVYRAKGWALPDLKQIEQV